MKKKMIVMVVVIAVVAILAALLIWKFSGNSSAVSEGATKVVTAMATCPNADLFNVDAVTAIGSGTSTSEADKEKTRAAAEKIEANWKTAVGKYFSEEGLKAFLLGSDASKYLAQAELEKKEISLKSIELVEKKDTWETVKVTILNADKEEQFEAVFQHDDKGLISKVTIS